MLAIKHQDHLPLNIRHKACDHVTSLKVVCSYCAEPITARDVKQEMSAAMLNERARMTGQVARRKSGART